MRKYLLLIGVLSSPFLHAQDFKSSIEARIHLLDKSPYWMRTNQFGSNPIDGPSLSLFGRASKETGVKTFDWGASVDVRADLGKNSRLALLEGYAKIKAGPVELRGGRVKEFMGLVDSTLSVGSFSYSGNALGVPKIEIRVPDFWPKRTLISFRGNYAHGWADYSNTKGGHAQIDSMYSYFHQKSLWIRLANPDGQFKLYVGIVDNAVWGDEYKMHSSFTLTKTQRYWSVVTGKNWSDSKVGNHVGNIDIKAEYDLDKYKLSLYRQFFYEVGALGHLANISDGLLGFSVQNLEKNHNTSTWKKALVELIYTKNQAGETWSKPTPTGNENYLNHYMYNDGWSYRKLGMGLPLVTRRADANQALPYHQGEYFVNNRLWGIHLGAEGKVQNWHANGKITYTRNFGTRKTQAEFPVQNQFSLLLGTQKDLPNGLTAGAQFGADLGGLLPHSAGLIFSLNKRLL